MGVGLVASGLIPSRPEDQAGFAINHAIIDDPSALPGVAPAHRAETAFELTYKTQLWQVIMARPGAAIGCAVGHHHAAKKMKAAR